MSTVYDYGDAVSGAHDLLASNTSIAKLAGEVYETAPVEDRRRLLDCLLRPLGMLSLLGVARGVFAKLEFHRAAHDMQIRTEDLAFIQTKDVVALVDYVQQASIDDVDLLAKVISSSPPIAGSSAAIRLVTLLERRSLARRSDFFEFDSPASELPVESRFRPL